MDVNEARSAPTVSADEDQVLIRIRNVLGVIYGGAPVDNLTPEVQAMIKRFQIRAITCPVLNMDFNSFLSMLIDARHENASVHTCFHNQSSREYDEVRISGAFDIKKIESRLRKASLDLSDYEIEHLVEWHREQQFEAARKEEYTDAEDHKKRGEFLRSHLKPQSTAAAR